MSRFLFLLALAIAPLAATTNLAGKIFTPTSSELSTYENEKQLVMKFYDSVQNNDLQGLSSILAADYQVTNAGDIQELSYSKFTEMSKNLKIRVTALHKALPGFSLVVSEVLVDGTKVIAKSTLSGVQKGTFLGVAPTNKLIHIKCLSIFTIQDDKIKEISEMWNELSVMKQLGYIVL